MRGVLATWGDATLVRFLEETDVDLEGLSDWLEADILEFYERAMMGR
jgi:hypothetical protein